MLNYVSNIRVKHKRKRKYSSYLESQMRNENSYCALDILPSNYERNSIIISVILTRISKALTDYCISILTEFYLFHAFKCTRKLKADKPLFYTCFANMKRLERY